MDTLTISNLIYWGRHGKTGDESDIAQPFEVTVDIKYNFEQAFQTDDLTSVVDYKDVEMIVKKSIEGKSRTLIETLAGEISDSILALSNIAREVQVVITKIRPKSLGIPSVTVTKLQMVNKEMMLKDFDFTQVVNALDTVGAISIPLIDEGLRAKLLEEACNKKYLPQPELVSKGTVREQLSSTVEFDAHGLLIQLRDVFERTVKDKALEYDPSGLLFGRPLMFNELSLQKYDPGSIGITPHMDFKRSRNLICILILKGTATFATCDDREGNNPQYIDATPGRMIIMRAPDYKGSDFRPFHYVTDITEERIVFGLRQISS
jgi:dihydroneopterin aldolase